jgi:hypothetical protein
MVRIPLKLAGEISNVTGKLSVMVLMIMMIMGELAY